MSVQEASGQIAVRFLKERRFVTVALPDVQKPTDVQVQEAMARAVVQPSMDIGGTVRYVACTVHPRDPSGAGAMLSRCESELREVAAALGIVLGVPE
jgi:hypothetical protein